MRFECNVCDIWYLFTHGRNCSSRTITFLLVWQFMLNILKYILKSVLLNSAVYLLFCNNDFSSRRLLAALYFILFCIEEQGAIKWLWWVLTVPLKQFVYDSLASKDPTRIQVSSHALHHRNKRHNILIQASLTCYSGKTPFRQKDAPFKQTRGNV